MAEIDYDRLLRVITRGKELGEAATANASVRLAWNDLLKPAAETYLTAHEALVRAESAAAKEGKEAHEALAAFDLPYSLARAVVQAYLPSEVLPDTLKSLPTDTDRKNAIVRLRHVIEEHHADPWAATLLTGDFGTKADSTVREVTEWIAANGDLDKAVKARAAAYGAAYEQYLAFKNIVRVAHGNTSQEYQRIHIRGRSSKADGAGEATATTGTGAAAPNTPA